MKEEYSKALFEVYVVLKNTKEEVKNKIPKKFINFIEENMDKNYRFKLKENVGLEKQDLMHETKQILALIYRDYIVTKEERKKLILLEKKIRNKNKEQNKEKYNIKFNKNVDNKKESVEKINTNKENLLVKSEKEKWYKKIINNILNILKTNN